MFICLDVYMKRKKYQSIITQRIQKVAGKLGAAVLVLVFFSSLMAMGGTNAGFLDEEKSEGDSLTSGTLDMVASEKSFVYSTGTAPMEPGDIITQKAEIENVGSLGFQYRAKYTSDNDSDLCKEIILKAKLNDVEVYDDKLEDFDTSLLPSLPLNLNKTGKDEWKFIYSLPADVDSSAENETCEFNYKFTAWQTDFSDKTLGFWDEELLDPNASIEIESGEWASAGDVVINEIMWMGNDDGSDDNDEWIELRNMTNEKIDISGWDIMHGGSGIGGHIEIPHGYSIKPNGYFLITKEKWDNTAIKLSGDLDKDEGYTHVSGMSLLNTGEDLILLDKNKNTIDTAWKDAAWPAGCNNKSGVCDGLSQSMERKDMPGDGTLSGSWHTCVSGDCNSGTYWKTAGGNNYGTPGKPNLSPVVMNEIVFNPAEGEEEWAELYNMLQEDFDVSGWYFKNEDGGKVVISKSNTKSGKTKVPGEGYLVVKLGNNFLDDDSDTLSFYSDMGTPDDEDDDVREDVFKYKDSTKEKGDSFMRIPDGIGIWIDPEATPGKENELGKKEIKAFQLLTYDACFKENRLKKSDEEVCAPVFLEYIGMLKDIDDEKIDKDALEKILEMKEEEKKKKIKEMMEKAEEMVAVGSVPNDPVLPSEQNDSQSQDNEQNVDAGSASGSAIEAPESEGGENSGEEDDDTENDETTGGEDLTSQDLNNNSSNDDAS